MPAGGLNAQEQSVARVLGKASDPLRFLFAVNTPWTESLGVPRVSIEISRRLQTLGHECAKYSFEDAFPRGLTRLTQPFANVLFQQKLIAHLKQYGHRYDVVQAECLVLTQPRESYQFDGVLVSKSNGLPHTYHRHFQNSVLPLLKKKANERGSAIGNFLRKVSAWLGGGLAGIEQGFSAADQIHLLNHDELAIVRDELGFGDKCVLIPNGLSEARAAALHVAMEPSQGSDRDLIAFVGTWSLRKGSLEIPRIVRLARSRRPSARFRLIGVLATATSILQAMDPQDREHVEIVERFTPDELPALLADAKCGLFPSYIEGFPLGLLEMLAAGVPVVAWDVPGPREMIGDDLGGVLVPAGNVNATVDALDCLLDNKECDSDRAAAITSANRFRWDDVTERFLRSVRAVRRV